MSLIDSTTRPLVGHGFAGETLVPGDPGYDDARRVFNAMVDRRPALVARCTCAHDVAVAIEHARANDLPLAVRGGGHGVAGFAVCDGGVVVDLSPMKGIHVDPVARAVRVEAGVLWGELDAATQAHGLAVTGGRISTTGVAGLTLGSGSGWLERRHGFSADNLLSVEMVTADGQLVRASAGEHPDLFWALRGGSGNFGVVTAFSFRLHPVGPVVYAGQLLFDFADAPAVVRAWRDFIASAPDDVGSAAVAITAPPAPFVPEALRGRPALGIIAAWFGDLDEGERALAPLREAAAPAVDTLGPMPYVELQRVIDVANPPGQRQYWKSENLPALGDDAVDTWLEHAARMTSPFTQIVLEPKSGACARVPEDATPLRRDAAYTHMVFSVWDDPAEDELHIGFAREMAAAMAPFTIPGVVLNYTSDTGDERVRRTYGEAKYARMVAAKRRWDPDNVFRLNQNIRP